jgi:hypothetical protein
LSPNVYITAMVLGMPITGAAWADAPQPRRTAIYRTPSAYVPGEVTRGTYQRHLMTVLREYEDFYNTHRPHRTLNQAAPLRPLPDSVTDLDHFRIQRRDCVGGVIHEYRLVA